MDRVGPLPQNPNPQNFVSLSLLGTCYSSIIIIIWIIIGIIKHQYPGIIITSSFNMQSDTQQNVYKYERMIGSYYKSRI